MDNLATSIGSIVLVGIGLAVLGFLGSLIKEAYTEFKENGELGVVGGMLIFSLVLGVISVVAMYLIAKHKGLI